MFRQEPLVKALPVLTFFKIILRQIGKYLEFIRDNLVFALAEIYLNVLDNDIPRKGIYLQRADTSAHFDAAVGRILGDVCCFIFSLCGRLKNRVYEDRPHTFEGLQLRIRVANTTSSSFAEKRCFQLLFLYS